MRWIVSIVVALGLVGAGAIRTRAEHRSDPHARSELVDASHLTAKVTPRRISAPAPDQRLSTFTVPVASLAIAAPRRAIWLVAAALHRTLPVALLPGWRCRGPPV